SPPLAILIASVQAAICESAAEPCASATAAAAAQTSPAFPPRGTALEATLALATSNEAVVISTPNLSDMRASRCFGWHLLSFSYAHTNPR
ncbi:MAG TPA: hypothetical protein VN935_11725, partial [Rhizomicrobium sp.]|nr:hypothetical protein [Rhizomicrobium sp.]